MMRFIKSTFIIMIAIVAMVVSIIAVSSVLVALKLVDAIVALY